MLCLALTKYIINKTEPRYTVSGCNFTTDQCRRLAFKTHLKYVIHLFRGYSKTTKYCPFYHFTCLEYFPNLDLIWVDNVLIIIITK